MEKILLALAALETKITSLFAAKASAENDPKLKAATEEALALAKDASDKLATATSDLAARDAKILSLTADLEKAQGQVNAHGTEIKTLTDKLAAEAKRTDETLAALGVDPKTIPAAPAPKAAAKTLNRAAFSQLSPSEKSTFCRTGGKITE